MCDFNTNPLHWSHWSPLIPMCPKHWCQSSQVHAWYAHSTGTCLHAHSVYIPSCKSAIANRFLFRSYSFTCPPPETEKPPSLSRHVRDIKLCTAFGVYSTSHKVRMEVLLPKRACSSTVPMPYAVMVWSSGKINNAIYHNILPLVAIYCYLPSIMHYMHKLHQWHP